MLVASVLINIDERRAQFDFESLFKTRVRGNRAPNIVGLPKVKFALVFSATKTEANESEDARDASYGDNCHIGNRHVAPY